MSTLPKSPEELGALRDEIDRIDRTLIQTLAARQEIVRSVISDKINGAKTIRDKQRERELLHKIRGIALEHQVDPYFAEQLFREIIQQSVRYQNHSLFDHQNDKLLQTHISVGFQGIEGSYSQQAAIRHFQERFDEVQCLSFGSFEQAATAVEEGKVEVALLPIENTTAGSINETYDLLGDKELYIVGEEVLTIHHCLVGIEPVELEHIRRVLSHPLTLAQCSKFLSGLTRCRVESYSDSALAALKILDDADLSQVAIASPYAAERYGLTILDDNVANIDPIYSRFVVVAKQLRACDPQLPCKTSIVLSTQHEKGALIQCLNVLDSKGFNLSKLESRPRIDRPWQYRFYIDIEGNLDDPRMKDALSELESKSASLKVLGCYPTSTHEHAS